MIDRRIYEMVNSYTIRLFRSRYILKDKVFFVIFPIIFSTQMASSINSSLFSKTRTVSLFLLLHVRISRILLVFFGNQ